MKRFASRGAVLMAAALLSALASVGAAQPPPTVPAPQAAGSIDPALAGHYYLEGMMETGSELLLRPDDRFQWYFSYGALDLTAEGRWHRDGDAVWLDPDATDGPAQYPDIRFERMHLRIDGAALVPAWPWEDGAERGRYVRE